jgi:hypothetical protein
MKHAIYISSFISWEPSVVYYDRLWKYRLIHTQKLPKNDRNEWPLIKQQWTIEEISIFSNSIHLEWRAGLSDTILKGTHPRTIPARFGLIWFRGFRAEDLNVKV